MTDRHNPVLDGVRAWAILLVLFSHWNSLKIVPFGVLNIEGFGPVGVFLFFFLSGFLLSTPFFRDPESIFKQNVWIRYGVRRFFRVVPLFLLVVITDFYFLHFYFDDAAPFSEMVKLLFFIRGKNIFWSIIAEVRFYILFPLLIILYGWGLKEQRRLVTLGALYIIFVFFWSYLFDLRSIPYSLGVTGYIRSFFIGILAARIALFLETIRPSFPVRIVSELASIVSIVVLILFCPTVWTQLHGNRFEDLPSYVDFYLKYNVTLSFLFAAIVLGALHAKLLVARFLSLPIFRFIALISYSVYLIHLPILVYCLPITNASPVLGEVLTLGIVFGSSFLLYRAVELGGQRIGKNLLSRFEEC